MSINIMNPVLTYGGFRVPLQMLKRTFGKKYSALIEKLTLVHRPTIGAQKIIHMYTIKVINGIQYIILPRCFLAPLSNIFQIRTIFKPLINIKGATLAMPLYPNQHIVVEHLCNNIFNTTRVAAGTASALLNMKAGMGKTFVSAGLIATLKYSTLYVVPKRPIMMQTVKHLSAALKGVRVTEYRKDKTPDHDVLVIVINSVLKQSLEFFSRYSMVIFDEVHMYCSEQRKEIFSRSALPIMFGMSATTEDRGDGFDVIAHKELALDGIIYATSIPGFVEDEDEQFDCRAKIINYYGPPQYTQNLKHPSTGKVFTHYMHHQFISDPYRTRVAVDALVELYDQGHCIYVFAEEIEILNQARDVVSQELKSRNRDDMINQVVCENELCMFTGGLKDERVAEISRSARILFSTYGYGGTGISINKMTAILLLTPRRANMKQIFGRILRSGSDVSVPRIVVDIVDKKTCLYQQLNDRFEAYSHYEFKIDTCHISYEDILNDHNQV